MLIFRFLKININVYFSLEVGDGKEEKSLSSKIQKNAEVTKISVNSSTVTVEGSGFLYTGKELCTARPKAAVLYFFSVSTCIFFNGVRIIF